MKKTSLLLLAAIGLLLTPQAVLAHDQLHELGEVKYLLTYDMLQSALAKELCSCHYIAGLTLDQCEAHIGLPQETLAFVAISETADHQIIARPTNAVLTFPYAVSAVATFNMAEPRLGCRLTYGMIEALQQQAY